MNHKHAIFIISGGNANAVANALKPKGIQGQSPFAKGGFIGSPVIREDSQIKLPKTVDETSKRDERNEQRQSVKFNKIILLNGPLSNEQIAQIPAHALAFPGEVLDHGDESFDIAAIDAQAVISTVQALKEGGNSTLTALKGNKKKITLGTEEPFDLNTELSAAEDDREALLAYLDGDDDLDLIIPDNDLSIREEQIEQSWGEHLAASRKQLSADYTADYTKAEAQKTERAYHLSGTEQEITVKPSAVLHALRRQIKAERKALERGKDQAEARTNTLVTLPGSARRQLKAMLESGSESPVIMRAQTVFGTDPNQQSLADIA